MAAAEFALHQCGPEDAATLSLTGAATFLEAYAGLLPAEAILWHCTSNHSESAYAKLLAEPATRAWLAEVPPTWATGRGAPIGYAVLSAPDFEPKLLQPRDLELKRIYCFSRFYGMGVGQRLIEAVLAAAQGAGGERLLLGMHRDNRRALAFYQRNGFEIAGERRFRLGDDEFDDYVLARKL